MRKTHFIFGIVVLSLLIFFDGPLVKQMVEQYFSKNYPDTIGQVVFSEVDNFTTYGGKFSSRHIHYFPKIKYRYEINNETYQNQRFCYARYYSEEFSKKAVADHPVGSQIQIFYNPKNPQDALLSAGFDHVDSGAIIQIFIQANFVIAVVIVVWCIRIRRQTKFSKQLPIS
jgi:hypothetical protein